MFNNDIPIYLQLAEKIKIDIFSGRLKSGDKLSSVRELALRYQVNPNTIQRALSELESTELIYTDRTNGKYVTDDNKLIAKYRKLYAKEITKEYRAKMKEIGFSIKEEK